jgi:hypothetical protein
MLRKQIMGQPPRQWLTPDVKDIPALATVLITSEAPDHPIDHAFDSRGGRGGTRWVAAADGEQTVILAFDMPQTIRQIIVEVEETSTSRTQVLSISVSEDSGRTFREQIRQEFNFSPPGTTFEREEWSIDGPAVTHLRVVIQPDKGGAFGRATLTTLAIR